MWIVQLGLHFGADLSVAYITSHAAGYDQASRPKTWDLALFFASRPRMAWILLSILGNSAETFKEKGFNNVQETGPIDSYWTSAAKQTMIVEAIMQLVGTYYLGRTAHFATSHGYYLLHQHYDSDARLMYGGALFSLICTYLSLFGIWMTLYEGVPLSAFVFGYTVYIGNWLFWAGYVKLAAELYVVPFPLFLLLANIQCQ